MKVLEELKKKAKLVDANIVLPEANIDDRVYKACKYILKHKLSRITVFGRSNQFDEDFKSDLCTIIDISRTKKVDSFANQLFELRKGKIASLEEAKALVKNPNYFACMLVYNKMADGVVIGAKYTTKDAIKPALQIIKAKDNKKVSGLMLLAREDHYPIVCSDVSLQIAPNEEELAEIAINAGEFAKKIGDECGKELVNESEISRVVLLE